MRRGKSVDKWFPLWIDKWIFGSTRHELIIVDEKGEMIDLRGVFIDLLALAKKDEGYIRANEFTPYPKEQLAGLFCVPTEYLEKVIKICLQHEKLSEPSPGIFFVNSNDVYSLTERHVRRISTPKNTMSVFPDMMSEKTAPFNLIYSNIISSNKEGVGGEEKKKPEPITETKIDELFLEFWTGYPHEGRLAKKESRQKFGAIVKRGQLAELIKGTRGYIDYLKHRKLKENFEQRPMYAKTFLNGRWQEFVGFEFKPDL